MLQQYRSSVGADRILGRHQASLLVNFLSASTACTKSYWPLYGRRNASGREHVENVLRVRHPKYAALMRESVCGRNYMLSLLDLRIWIALALALVAAFVMGDGTRSAADQRNWQARETLIAVETAERQAAATEQVRLTERAMSARLATVETQHVKEMEHVRSENARLVADIRTRRLRQYISGRPADINAYEAMRRTASH